MARKTLGFVPLIWKCDSCGTLNPGPIKTCTSCGAPQPTDVEFLRVDEEQFNFIKDEALIREAKAGPDIHCPYCGTRNPADAKLCSNCGGNLTLDSEVRKTGQEVRTLAEAGTPPPAASPEPKKKRGRMFTIFVVIGGLAIVAACIVLLMLLLNTDDVSATVTDIAWERQIAIEEFTTVTQTDWWDEVPADGEIKSCTQSYRYTADEPVANSTEVCGEERVEDTGTGIGEVVQDCVYEVYDDYCEYTILAWVVVETVTAEGEDLNPSWPAPILNTDQRLGERSETYIILFSADGETYRYTTQSEDLYLAAEPGSRWKLEVNQLGGVKAIEPAN